MRKLEFRERKEWSEKSVLRRFLFIVLVSGFAGAAVFGSVCFSSCCVTGTEGQWAQSNLFSENQRIVISLPDFPMGKCAGDVMGGVESAGNSGEWNDFLLENRARGKLKFHGLKLLVRGSDFYYEKTVQSREVEIVVPRDECVAVLAYPEVYSEETENGPGLYVQSDTLSFSGSQALSDFFYPAGTVYPYGTGLSWEGGFASSVLSDFYRNAKETGNAADTMKNYAGSFNWKKFLGELEKRSELSDEYNPWFLDKQQILTSIEEGSFSASLLKVKGTKSISVEEILLTAEKKLAASGGKLYSEGEVEGVSDSERECNSDQEFNSSGFVSDCILIPQYLFCARQKQEAVLPDKSGAVLVKLDADNYFLVAGRRNPSAPGKTVLEPECAVAVDENWGVSGRKVPEIQLELRTDSPVAGEKIRGVAENLKFIGKICVRTDSKGNFKVFWCSVYLEGVL